MTKIKRRFCVAGALAVGAFITLNAIAYRHAYAMLHFTNGSARTGEPESLGIGQKMKVLLCGVTIPRPQTTNSPAMLAPDCKAISFAGTNGVKLGAWYCPGAPGSSLVILFHGYTGEKSGTVPEARVFREMGFSVLLVDFRGSGDSSESYTTVGYAEGEDVASALRYARAQLGPRKVILYGKSMGGAAILRAVHDCGARPDGIIVESVFDNMLSTVRNRFNAMGVPSFPCAQLLVFWGGRQFGFNGFANNPADFAASVCCPILFLHGADDPRARIQEARRVFAAVPGPKQFEEFPGLAHETSVSKFRLRWQAAVEQLLRKVEE
jgi:alpha-beta hydrolase superfamily lysophospholipase